MTTESDLRAIKKDLGELAKAVEQLAEVVKKLCDGTSASGFEASSVSSHARQVKHRHR